VLDAAGELMNAAAQIFSMWLKIYGGVFHFALCSSNPHRWVPSREDDTGGAYFGFAAKIKPQFLINILSFPLLFPFMLLFPPKPNRTQTKLIKETLL